MQAVMSVKLKYTGNCENNIEQKRKTVQLSNQEVKE